jgi:hypothetical protein
MAKSNIDNDRKTMDIAIALILLSVLFLAAYLSINMGTIQIPALKILP